MRQEQSPGQAKTAGARERKAEWKMGMEARMEPGHEVWGQEQSPG